MPLEIPIAQAADGDPVFDHVGHDRDLGIALVRAALHYPALVRQRAGQRRGILELAKTPRKGDEVSVGKALTAEEHDQVVEPRTADFRGLAIGHRAQVAAAHLGAQRPLHGHDFHVHTPFAFRLALQRSTGTPTRLPHSVQDPS